MNAWESHCVDALLNFLSSRTHSKWFVDVGDLDVRYPDRRTPEALISDGSRSAAVEVKGLLGTQGQNDFFGDLISLGRLLAPTTPGHWVIAPPNDRSPLWAKPFIKVLKAEIERVTASLEVGVRRGTLKIPRRALMVMGNESGAQVICWHGRPRALRQTGSIGTFSGIYLLQDHDGCAALESEEGKATFLQAVADTAIRIGLTRCNEWLEWEDEWLIWLVDDETSLVEVIATLGAFLVAATVDQTVWKAIEDGARKFDHRWAEHHILLLDSQFAFTDVNRVRRSISELRKAHGQNAFDNLDEVILYCDDEMSTLYPLST